MFDHFWLDLVVWVLSNFVCSVLFGFSQTKKKKILGLVSIVCHNMAIKCFCTVYKHYQEFCVAWF